MKKDNFIKINWNDVYFYTHRNLIKRVPKMVTLGTMYEKNDNYIIVANPLTISTRKKTTHPENSFPKYYYIPNGMISAIKEISSEKMKKELEHYFKMIEENLTKKQSSFIKNKIAKIK